MTKIKDTFKIAKPMERNKGAGHRKRLRSRFLQGGLDGFLDYEIVELLLTLGTPRKDCKQMGKEAIKMFGGLRDVLDASLDELQQIKGIGSSNAFGIKLFQAVSERYSKENLPKRISLSSLQEVIKYLREKIGKEKKEYFLILSLDSRNNLIRENIVSIGTLTETLVHPREVFKEAIDAHATSIILAHNHPSGDSEPSEDDLDLTKKMVGAGKILGIEVVDHVIISNLNSFSFKDKGLI